MRDYSSCVRFAYCRFHKDEMEFNDVRKSRKSNLEGGEYNRAR